MLGVCKTVYCSARFLLVEEKLLNWETGTGEILSHYTIVHQV